MPVCADKATPRSDIQRNWIPAFAGMTTAKKSISELGAKMNCAEKEFKSLVQTWAKKIGVAPKRIQIQRMTKKWASCSTAGQISFNKDLLKSPRTFREAVIIHELVHLAVPNHGRLFKSMFLSFLPNGEWLLKRFGINNRM